MKKWSTLSKKDKKHLRESNIKTKWQFEEQVKFMKNEFKKHPQERIICYDCKNIAIKLKMWDDKK